MIKKIYVILLISLIASCSGPKTEQSYPKSVEDIRHERQGKITGEEGWVILGAEKDETKGMGITVNSFLWRATLDTLSFAPLASADPIGGVIITEWYENPEARGERFKINATVLDKRLRSDGIKVAVFKQTLDKNGSWRDDKVTPNVAKDLETKILTRARELKIKQAR